MIDPSDLSHDVNDSKIQHMGQAWQMMLDRIERIDMALFKDWLDCFASCIIVACIVSRDAEKVEIDCDQKW